MSENAGPNFLPHVLVITADEDGEKHWDIEHPGCPEVCFWWKGAREWIEEEIERGRREGFSSFPPLVEGEPADPGYRTCYVEHETSNSGLDCLDLGDDPPDDGSYTPDGPFAQDQWRQLPVGRYIIEGWFTPQGWAGSEPIDADGGLTLIGPDIGGRYFLPAASDHEPGDWFIWSGASGSNVVLLCVDLPVAS